MEAPIFSKVFAGGSCHAVPCCSSYQDVPRAFPSGCTSFADTPTTTYWCPTHPWFRSQPCFVLTRGAELMFGSHPHCLLLICNPHSHEIDHLFLAKRSHFCLLTCRFLAKLCLAPTSRMPSLENSTVRELENHQA